MVKKVDTKAGNVVLAHDPVATMNWPAMTMGFKVNDPTLLEKLSVGKKVEFQFSQQGREYVISSVK